MPLVSIRYLEPVTVRAAPRKVNSDTLRQYWKCLLSFDMSFRASTAAALALSLLVPSARSLQAQDKALTIDAIFDPDRRVDFSGSPPTGLTWLDAAHYVWGRRSDN